MTPEAQNIAIAKVLGRKFHHPTEEELRSGSYYQYEPDYTRDLNTMNDAEKAMLAHGQHRQRYVSELRAITADIDVWHATAAQRAEAFLRTLGLWTT